MTTENLVWLVFGRMMKGFGLPNAKFEIGSFSGTKRKGGFLLIPQSHGSHGSSNFLNITQLTFQNITRSKGQHGRRISL